MNNSTILSNFLEPIDFGRPFYLNSFMFLFGSLITLINGNLLIRMTLTRYLLKAKRYAFLINMTFCDLCSGLIMIGLAIANVIGGDGPLVCLLQGETCLNLCLTMSCYTCSIILQFIAVRYPIYYKTSVTRAKIITAVGVCWIYAILFSGIKLTYVLAVTHQNKKVISYHIFPYLDVILKFAYLIGNCIGFSYVLVIALVRRRQQPISLRKKSWAPLEEKEENEEEEENEKVKKFSKRTATSYIHHYEAIMTSGMRLLLYLGTCLPLTVFCTYVLVTNQASAMNPGKVYGDSRDIGVSLVLLWFCRALIDPFITLVREKPMDSRRASTSLSSRRTTLTSLSSQFGRTNSLVPPNEITI